MLALQYTYHTYAQRPSVWQKKYRSASIDIGVGITICPNNLQSLATAELPIEINLATAGNTLLYIKLMATAELLNCSLRWESQPLTMPARQEDAKGNEIGRKLTF
jgi:hypothetical protein